MVEAENSRQEVLSAAFDLLDDQVLARLVCGGVPSFGPMLRFNGCINWL
jgi:hypothetical protein